MIALSLAEIADIVSGRLVTAGDDDDTVVSGVVETDSRLIGAGDIFVAKPGEHSDGHLFVPAAAQAGAALAIVEHVVDADVPQIIVDDVLDALADLARAVVERVREHGDLRVVAITGSNG
ncbi:MAG TPA: Mur ligase domain-containing protein, partial [Microbacterium sp.]|nr:Mur ligase domain-containing protein [Microbacterium sp.]